ncbi:MAG: M15 family metallopeptidase [Clostridia bacterium]|nr:M15 family metallopeptidase [Clostridia bacterium]
MKTGEASMAGKSTGKYYAPVYRARKSPVKMRYSRIIRRSIIIAAAVAFAAVSIAAVQISREESDSFVKVAASRQSLANVQSYPRVVSSSAPLPDGFAPENLMSLGMLPNGEDILLRADAAEAFLSMCAAMSEDGLGIVPISGYVSFDEQRALLDSTADRLVAEGVSTEEARQRASQEVSAPGQDEAQLGTSIDVSTDISSPSGFSLTEQYQWICRNAHKYGFIIRYTASKRKVTGVAEKPWRLRYVGVQAAECMVSSNMCLEEYADAVRSDNPDATEEF